MKKDKEIEKILLHDEEYEKLIHLKIEEEFKKAVNNDNKSKEIITDIKKVPTEGLFSKNAVYMVLNKSSKTKSFINGIQAEGFLGTQNIQREKIISKNADYFICADCYIKFYSWRA